jgi:hypothetical protein
MDIVDTVENMNMDNVNMVYNVNMVESMGMVNMQKLWCT